MKIKYEIKKVVYDKEKKCKSCGWENTRFVKIGKVEMCPTCLYDFLEKGNELRVI